MRQETKQTVPFVKSFTDSRHGGGALRASGDSSFKENMLSPSKFILHSHFSPKVNYRASLSQ